MKFINPELYQETLVTDLNLGIRFEEVGAVLKWGKSINSLLNEFGKTREIIGNSIHYNWGKQKILNGLEIELITSFANIGYPRWFRKKFNKIESWAIGDDVAIKEYDRISSHIKTHFGQAIEEMEDKENREKHLLWKVENVEISLYLFEQHCYKLHFLIEKSS
jgi:hypothetical protein